MNYTGSSCEDIYSINGNQWSCCSMTANSDFITTCAGVGGGWRRIVNININAGDDCPGEVEEGHTL